MHTLAELLQLKSRADFLNCLANKQIKDIMKGAGNSAGYGFA